MSKILLTSRNVLLVMMSVIFAVNILGESVTTAYAASDPRDTIIEYVRCMGNDWDRLAELTISEGVEGYKIFLHNEENIKEHIGILNITNAELMEIVEIAFDDAKEFLFENYDYYEVRTFVVGIDYSVYEDNIFYSNGISYVIISLILEDLEWRIAEDVQISEPEYLLNKGYEFEEEYYNTVEMMNARDDGMLINGNGEEFDTIGEIIEMKNQSKNNIYSLYSTINTSPNTEAIPKDSTLLCIGNYSYNNCYYYIKADGSTSTSKCKMTFKEYCLGVTAGEVRGKKFDGTPRRAVIIAIKTFTWYYILHPQKPQFEINLHEAKQKYNPQVVDENPVVRVDYAVVKNIWMESYDRTVFYAEYSAGNIEDYKKYEGVYEYYKGSGHLHQNGCIYLAQKGKTYKEILRYFYDFSTKSTNKIRFFNSFGRYK